MCARCFSYTSAGVRDAALKEKRQRLGKGGELGSDDEEAPAAAADAEEASDEDDDKDGTVSGRGVLYMCYFVTFDCIDSVCCV
jgi:hypothetical protein